MTPASSRIWNFAAAFFMIIVIALGWFLGVSPKLAEANRFDSERRNVEAQNDLARVAIAQLEADFAMIEELRDALRELRSEFSTQAQYDAVFEEFLRGMISDGLTLQNVVVNEPSPTSATAAAEGEQPAPEIDGEGELPNGSLLQVTASITVSGSLDQVLAFVDRLQMSSRFMIVPTGSFSEGSDPEASAMSFTLIMYVVTGDELPGDEVQPPVEPEPEPTEPEPTETPDPDASDPPAEPTPAP